MPHEQVYESILARINHDELSNQCRDVAHREAKLVDRRIRGARRALQHVYDVSAAIRLLPSQRVANPETVALIKEVEELQSKLASRMHEIAARAAQGPVVALGAEPSSTESTEEMKYATSAELEPLPSPQVAERGEEAAARTSTKRRRLKRRLSQDSMDSPRKPPRPGRLCIADDELFEESIGPHDVVSAGDDTTEDESPVELDVLDSDTEVELASYLEKARRLRKISSDRRMSELPGLIRGVLAEINRHDWGSLPRELLGTLSATLGAATTLKSAQREQLSSELSDLRRVALKIDQATARQYPTLLGSKTRFLSSLEIAPTPPTHSDAAQSLPTTTIELPTIDEATTREHSALLRLKARSPSSVPTPPMRSDAIESLSTATAEISKRMEVGEETNSMEELDGIMELVGYVFDNPNAVRSDQYNPVVARSLDILIKYVHDIPRNTRRKLQCEQLLQERRMELNQISSSGSAPQNQK